MPWHDPISAALRVKRYYKKRQFELNLNSGGINLTNHYFIFLKVNIDFLTLIYFVNLPILIVRFGSSNL